MNYFEFYGLPVTFHPDQNVVKQQFYALSKKYHPDFYINENTQKQEEALEYSTLNNKAFQLLKAPKKVLQYVLELKGTIKEGENYTLPSSFLMEMMDVNESIMDLQLDPDPQKIEKLSQEIQYIADNLDKELQQYTCDFEQQTEVEQTSRLQKIKDIYYREKYIWRLRESLSKI